MFGNKITAEVDPTIAAEAFTNGLLANLTANGGVDGGNLGLTTHICLMTNDGKIQVGSADDGNEVVFYQTGTEFSAGTVKTRVFLSKGEVYIETGCEVGTIVTSTKGMCGASGASGPMPLGTEGYAGRQFFLFAFRNSTDEKGEVYVACGAVASEVELLNGSGDTVVDSASLSPFEVATLLTDADSEFQVVANQPVFVGIASGMGTNPQYADLRLVPPLSTKIIGGNRNARVSALYNNTEVWWYRHNGRIGKFTVSPGSPASTYTGTINELGDVFYIESNSVPSTGGIFTIGIDGDNTASIQYDAGASEIITALNTFTNFSSADFKVETIRGDNLGNGGTQIMIYAMGLLERVEGSPTIDTSLLSGNAHTSVIYQDGSVSNNAGNTSNYASQGTLIFEANGPISSLCGADGAGNEATYFVPVSALTQRIPLYLGTSITGNGNTSGVCVQSPYKGSYKIFRQDGSLAYSNSFDRDGSLSIDSSFKQRFPCAWNLTGTGGNGNDSILTEPFTGGYIEADVPINLVMNSQDNESNISGGFVTEGDEIIFYGITPDSIRAEIRLGLDGRSRKRTIANDGAETWELT